MLGTLLILVLLLSIFGSPLIRAYIRLRRAYYDHLEEKLRRQRLRQMRNARGQGGYLDL